MVEAVPVCDQLALPFPCRVHDMSHHVSRRLSAKMCKSLEMICTSPNGTACRHDSTLLLIHADSANLEMA